MAHASDMIADDIVGYLKQHEEKDILRFLTCGNVDDGKSTLIGRLLHDSKLIFEDQLAAIKKDSKKFNTTDEEFDLALLVDGLQSEREQGITIDVAYRYFSTDKRKFIIADCPGHEQYTRNMATGASSCDVAVILIDARKGIQTQTRRHSYIVSLLGIKNVIVAVNKMDLVDFSEDVFTQVTADYQDFAENLGFKNIYPVPLSALKGDNVVDRSTQSDWYTGPTMIEMLESIQASNELAEQIDGFRMPVQYVNRPNLDFRGFCGTVAAGELRPGDLITTLPSGKQSKVSRIVTADGDLDLAVAGEAITITLEDEIDISRGDIIYTGNKPLFGDIFVAELVWMHEDALQVGKEYLFKAGTKSVFGKVTAIQHRVDVNTMEHIPAEKLQLNEVGLVTVSFNSALALDEYIQVAGTGSFVVIDRISNVTVGAGMARNLADVVRIDKSIVNMTSEEKIQAFNAEIQLLSEKYFGDMK